jgi:hypothetical protein
MGYTGYFLSAKSREDVLRHFPPKFPRIIAEHVTHIHGVDETHPLPPAAKIEIYGYACIDGIEALAVTVDGQKMKPDGRPYHITLSLDPARHSPVDSNNIVREKLGWQDVAVDITIETEPRYSAGSKAAPSPPQGPKP